MILFIIFFTGVASSDFVEIVTPETVMSSSNVTISPDTDSYLEAYRASHTAKNRIDNHYPPEPAEEYLPVVDIPSEIFYSKKPAITYGPVSPLNHNYYVPAMKPSPSPIPYGMPMVDPQQVLLSVLPSILPKAADLQTIFKLILKLVLFKMIVKFIAVVCLLLVWPLFNKKESDEERQMEALGELTELVWNSVFPQKNGGEQQQMEEEDGESLVEKVAGQIDEKMTVPSEEAAIGFLEFCVSAANAVVGWMMGFLRRRRNEVDPLEETLWTGWEKAKTVLLRIVKS